MAAPAATCARPHFSFVAGAHFQPYMSVPTGPTWGGAGPVSWILCESLRCPCSGAKTGLLVGGSDRSGRQGGPACAIHAISSSQEEPLTMLVQEVPSCTAGNERRLQRKTARVPVCTFTVTSAARRRRGTPRASDASCVSAVERPRERLPCRPPGRLRAGAPLQPASWPHRLSSLLSKLFPFIRAAAVGRSRPAESSTSLFDWASRAPQALRK